MVTRSEQDGPVVYSISDAPVSAKVDHDRRVRGYLISMGIRTASFVLAYVFWFVFELQWVAWVFVALAVVLPYPAVMLANMQEKRSSRGSFERPTRAIGPGSSGGAGGSQVAVRDAESSAESSQVPPASGRSWWVG
ncbi:Protein of uncharacterised function (DUF3099) [Dermatophilus congolensis]|uniref:Protein of uncharacterized function (DUF3099) n=1 Tax=Dermatophilus congolensis TaxID=1863 RepID=A0A239VN30_9MICO|nr:Protein of uncharacterised function (DUF3099) [Dermatophilus congolensis]